MYDLIVVGSGPAGLTAAIYARRAEKSVLVLEKETFGGENLHNGYARPFVRSNIWHSADKKDQKITLQWERPTEISRLNLFFDSNLNRFCRSAERDYTDLFYRMVKDYDVYCRAEDGSTRLLCRVRDNFQRVNELSFDPVVTDRITVDLLETHGQEFFSVYEIRCYR